MISWTLYLEARVGPVQSSYYWVCGLEHGKVSIEMHRAMGRAWSDDWRHSRYVNPVPLSQDLT